MRERDDGPRRAPVRRLSDEEIALWAEVARGVARRRGASLPALAHPKPPAPAPAAAAAPAGAAAPPRQPPGPPPLAPLERRLKRELARGRGAVDDAIDLHGLNQAEAHRSLRGFLVHAQTRGARLVIVVTGKGQPRDAGTAGWFDEPGVLRRLVPHWLRDAELRGTVLGFEEAGRAHGGAGALYVRLRRRERG